MSYSPVTSTSLWISSRKHFLVLTGKKKEIDNTDSIRTGKSSSAATRAMATINRPTRPCQPTSLTPTSNSHYRPPLALQRRRWPGRGTPTADPVSVKFGQSVLFFVHLS